MSDAACTFTENLRALDTLNNTIAKLTKFCYALIFLVGLLVCIIYNQSGKLAARMDEQRLILVPNLNKMVVVPDSSQLTEDYVVGYSKSLIAALEIYEPLSVKSQYQQMASNFLSPELTSSIFSDLEARKFFEVIAENHVQSKFSIDEEKSQFSFCAKIKSACALVVGKRTQYVDYVKPTGTTEVAYLVIANLTQPIKNQYALTTTRLDLEEGDGAYEKIQRLYNLAQEGKLK